MRRALDVGRRLRLAQLRRERPRVHEWSLFAEAFNDGTADRGAIFRLLTARVDNRVSLSWERDGVDVLMLEGHAFTYPWAARRLAGPVYYDLPNLLPADRALNHWKRDRLPSEMVVVGAVHAVGPGDVCVTRGGGPTGSRTRGRGTSGSSSSGRAWAGRDPSAALSRPPQGSQGAVARPDAPEPVGRLVVLHERVL